MYRPYFYIIQHIKSGKYYAGSKWGKSSHHEKQRNADPDFFMVEGGYQTSSNIVKTLIKEEGLSAFNVKVIRIFKTAEEARSYESRFLQRVKAKTNDRFLNKHENSLIAWGTEEHRQASLNKYGVEHPSQSEKVKEKARSTMLEKYGVEYGVLLEKARSTMLERYGVEYSMQSKEIQEVRRNNSIQKYGVSHHMQTKEVVEKMLDTKIEKYGSKVSPAEIKATIDRNATRSKRPNVLAIIELKNKHKLKLGRNWWMKSDSDIDNMLADLIQQYGDLNAESIP